MGFNLRDSLSQTMPGNGAVGKIQNIPLDRLVSYHNHPFKLYDGQRKEDLKESIRKNGIITPLIVHSINDGEDYEILVGHNRAACLSELGETYAPCIIKNGLSEEEAEAYVIESNIMQRGFEALSISEKSRILSSQYTKMFHQGRRNDIRAELEDIENMNHKNTGETLGTEYCLSSKSVARYVKLNKAMQNEKIKEWIDAGDISVRAGVELSYLDKGKLATIVGLVQTPKKELSEKHAKELRHALSETTADTNIEELFNEIVYPPKKKKLSITIPDEAIEKYFVDNRGKTLKKDSVLDMILVALENTYDEK